MQSSMEVKAPLVGSQQSAGSDWIIEPPQPAGESAGSEAINFAHSLAEAVRAADAKERLADEKTAAVDSGSSDDLVGAMLASQDASLSFSMLMQVRNKVVGALDDLLKLQL